MTFLKTFSNYFLTFLLVFFDLLNLMTVLKNLKLNFSARFVAIEGGRAHSHKRPTSLNFLDGLEMIEGRRLYHERFALYVIGNYELKWLGLRSLKKVKRGTVLIKGNRNLCYSQSIPFDRLLGVNGSSWRENKNTEECGSLLPFFLKIAINFSIFRGFE